MKGILSVIIFFSILTANMCVFSLAFGQGYAPLAPIPGYVEAQMGTNNLGGYLNAMFKLGIALAVGLAVVMIIVGGIQYMSTDALGKKNDGKARITAAIVGLLVALGSYMLLNTLDPNLLKTELDLADISGGVVPHEGEDWVSPHDPSNIVREYDDANGHHIVYKNGDVTTIRPDGTVETRDRNGNLLNESNSNVQVGPPPVPGGNHPQAPGGSRQTCSQLQGAIAETVEGLKAAGVTNPNAIAAILGHIQQESSFNGLENDVSDRTGARGIFQVGNPLWNRYTNWAAQNGYSPGSQYGQAFFMANFLKQSQPDLFNQFANAQSPRDALSMWGARPGHYGSKNGWNYWGTVGRRYEYADNYYNSNKDGQGEYICRE